MYTLAPSSIRANRLQDSDDNTSGMSIDGTRGLTHCGSLRVARNHPGRDRKTDVSDEDDFTQRKATRASAAAGGQFAPWPWVDRLTAVRYNPIWTDECNSQTVHRPAAKKPAVNSRRRAVGSGGGLARKDDDDVDAICANGQTRATDESKADTIQHANRTRVHTHTHTSDSRTTTHTPGTRP